ncbi:hypothetical protein NDU88_005928 [Pleurodeles waltl]|uniref:Uncharacterized protein n=1 Tax=Pleurodeles waltl TaxID=8319 RepID=A0AAV7SN95_PLEWA|nr:hypothetical protein NDU88_005928 [Pleurodeles waltl]
MDGRVVEALRLLREAGRLDLLADGGDRGARPARQAANGGCMGGVMYCRLEQVRAETENGHMTDENGWEENMTRQLQIRRGWIVAGLRR